mgnify:CR=1 FL=1
MIIGSSVGVDEREKKEGDEDDNEASVALYKLTIASLWKHRQKV